MSEPDRRPPPGDVEGDSGEPVERCVCGHPVERHDEVASRYCRVTISEHLERGCVCH